jgi:hypothetical protein
MVAVASVTTRPALASAGASGDGAPIASEKPVNASSVTAPPRAVSDSSPINGLLAAATWESTGLAAEMHTAATEKAAVLANIP